MLALNRLPGLSQKSNTRITEQDAKRALNKWVEALKTLKPDVITGLYGNDSHFTGTLAADVATCREGRISYFKFFFTGKHNLDAKFLTFHFNKIIDDVCQVSGQYRFTYQDNEGATQNIDARYTFTLKKLANGNVEILNHTSSVIPKSEGMTPWTCPPKPGNQP